ncbi:MAG: asparagine synthase (glutamine-hydrolyzing) [Vicinamibacteria bacterium]|nr:asparagine synthase (glutamine-hydrolyzing) [Vicinamibacteria bacterium]
MCGICGYAGFEAAPGLLDRMADSIRHRGPDSQGRFRGVASGLAVERLAMVDLARGEQPIRNEDGSVVLVLNGEIYNHAELRAGLEARGHRLRSGSDAEVVVHLYEEQGIACLNRLRGMFALGLHDLRRGETFLARDRLGLKPLYYWSQGGRLLFASETKALLESGLVSREVRLEAVDAYLRLRFVPGPATMIQGVNRLPAGHWLCHRGHEVRIERYWQLPIDDGGREQTDREWVEQFEHLFDETVRLHMRGDVAVGAYLSGGLDSSLVVAAAARVDDRLHTFSIGFAGEADEGSAARAMAAHAGTVHHRSACDADALRFLPQVVWHADEPPAAVALPLFLLARDARPHVKAVLSGEGADEVLAGYAAHRALEALRRTRSLAAPAVLRGAAWLASLASRSGIDLRLDHPAPLGRSGWQRIEHVLKAARGSLAATWEAAISLFADVELERLYRRGGPLVHLARRLHPVAGPDAAPGSLDAVLAQQFDTWLPDNVLSRQDKMSMAHSVEVRLPYLDHVLVEFLFTVPPHLKLRLLPPGGKILSRRLARHRLPAALASRRKQSLTVPLEAHLDSATFGELLASTLNEARVRRRGYFEPAAVRDLVQRARQTREFVLAKQVLALVLLELWHEQFVDGVRRSA